MNVMLTHKLAHRMKYPSIFSAKSRGITDITTPCRSSAIQYKDCKSTKFIKFKLSFSHLLFPTSQSFPNHQLLVGVTSATGFQDNPWTKFNRASYLLIAGYEKQVNFSCFF